MPFTDNIYRFRALMILLIFTLSLLPGQVLHDFISNHKHVNYSEHAGQQQLSVASFSCSADDVFLQHNYLLPRLDTDVQLKIVYASAVSPISKLYFSHNTAGTTLRGPPSLV